MSTFISGDVVCWFPIFDLCDKRSLIAKESFMFNPFKCWLYCPFLLFVFMIAMISSLICLILNLSEYWNPSFLSRAAENPSYWYTNCYCRILSKFRTQLFFIVFPFGWIGLEISEAFKFSTPYPIKELSNFGLDTKVDPQAFLLWFSLIWSWNLWNF